jgi:hypothetical protein
MKEIATLPAAREIAQMCKTLADVAESIEKGTVPTTPRDYLALLDRHGKRRRSAE